jgi:hypothetical protein
LSAIINLVLLKLKTAAVTQTSSPRRCAADLARLPKISKIHCNSGSVFFVRSVMESLTSDCVVVAKF